MNGMITRRAALAGIALAGGGLPMAARSGTAWAGESRRIVSAGGAVTEILFRLGREDAVVGVDSTSQFPPEALRTKPNIGYVRALGAEGILSLRPTLVLAAEGAGPPGVLRIVEDAGVRIVWVPGEPTPDGVLRRVAVVAEAVDAQTEGEALAGSLRAQFDALVAAQASLSSRRRVLVVLSLQNGRPLVGGSGTTADGMIALAGGLNAASALDGWKPLSDEGVIAAAPDVIVTLGRGGPDAAGVVDIFALPAFSATPAARTRVQVTLDALYLLGFGPRTPAAARDLMAAIYPRAEAGR